MNTHSSAVVFILCLNTLYTWLVGWAFWDHPWESPEEWSSAQTWGMAGRPHVLPAPRWCDLALGRRWTLLAFHLRAGLLQYFQVCFSSTWDHMESSNAFFHFKICMPSLRSVWAFPAHTCGMTSQKPHKQQIKLYGKKYSWLLSEETFLCLLNFIRNSQAEAMGHCSPTNQYNPSMHSLGTAKASAVSGRS